MESGAVDLSHLSKPEFWRIADAPYLADSPIADWDYETCRDFVRDAVESDAPPSPDLVAANSRLVLWEAQKSIGHVSSFPYTVSMPLTDVCNARCSFCAYIPERVVGRSTGIAEFSRLDWLKFVSSLNLNCGLGEPLMHKDFSEIVQFVRRVAPHLKMALITNASKLDDRNIDAILDYFSYLKVSMNATTKKTYEATMKIPWEPTIDGLKRLRDRKAAAGALLPKVRLSFVLHRHNLDEIAEAPFLAQELGADSIALANMVPVQKRWSDRYDRLMTAADVIESDYPHALKVMRRLKDDCARMGVKIFGAVPLVDDFDGDVADAEAMSLGDRKKMMRGAILKRNFEHVAAMAPGEMGEMHAPGGDGVDQIEAVATSTGFVRQVAVGFDPTCIDPWKNLRVGIRNEISPCCMFFGGLPAFDWEYASGRDFHDPRGTWNSAPMRRLRETMNSPPDEMPFCTACRTSHKQDPGQRDRFRMLKRESLRLLDAAYVADFNGDIDAKWPDVEALTLSDLGDVAPRRAHVPVFAAEPAHSRRRVDVLGLRLNGAIAYVGANLGLAPFLAEANRSLHIVGLNEPELVAPLAARLGLENMTASAWTPRQALPIEDASVDGVLLDGSRVALGDRNALLREMARILKPGGTFVLNNYPGVGIALYNFAHGVSKLTPVDWPKKNALTLNRLKRRLRGERFSEIQAARIRERRESPLPVEAERFLAACVERDFAPAPMLVERLCALVAGPGHVGIGNYATRERLRGLLAQHGLRARDEWTSWFSGDDDPEEPQPIEHDEPKDPMDILKLMLDDFSIATAVADPNAPMLRGMERYLNARGVRR